MERYKQIYDEHARELNATQEMWQTQELKKILAAPWWAEKTLEICWSKYLDYWLLLNSMILQQVMSNFKTRGMYQVQM